MNLNMIKVNENTEISNITSIVNDKSPSFSGIVSHECKGNLWVDNMDVPRAAIAESYAVGSFAFLGNYEAEEEYHNLKEFLYNELFVQLKNKGYDCFEFSIESKIMQPHIITMLKDRTLQSEKEYSFRIYSLPKFSYSIPDGYQIRKVDAAFWQALLEDHFENADFLKVRLLESWYSFDEFYKKSIAYCAVYHNRIVAVIVGTASYRQVIAIDIESEREHRRNGLAYALAVNFIEDCLSIKYIPQWDCVESNQDSCNMVKKLGFEQISENTVYWFSI